MNSREDEFIEATNEKKFKTDLIIWTVAGWAVIFGLGFLFRYMYEWIEWKPIGWLFPINESMWEQIKLGFWPGVFVYIAEYFFLRKKYNKVIVGRTEGLFVGIIAMLSFYYTMEGAFGVSGWSLSIGTFIFATVLQQFVGYFIINIEKELDDVRQKTLDIVSLISVGLLLVLMIVFTYVQVELPLFYDDVNGTYGFIN